MGPITTREIHDSLAASALTEYAIGIDNRNTDTAATASCRAISGNGDIPLLAVSPRKCPSTTRTAVASTTTVTLTA